VKETQIVIDSNKDVAAEINREILLYVDSSPTEQKT
jgi:hypothetical protein